MTDPFYNAGEDAASAGVFDVSEAEGVEKGDRTSTHCKDIPEDTANAGGCTLEGFDRRGVIVGFDFEGEAQSV
jgi:hypothetical protein